MKAKQDQLSGLYACPMHPEAHQDKPRKCPKCGMELLTGKQQEHNEPVGEIRDQGEVTVGIIWK